MVCASRLEPCKRNREAVSVARIGGDVPWLHGGLGIGGGAARVLSGMLYGVSPSDVTTLLSVVLLMLLVAALAALLPALRAARGDPMQVLREE